ncbi:MAG: hypothetical protein QF412_00555, partial [Planctomycetota bacterium]|nr:hypothetical protein [Planctomycetota bacterium]
SALWDQIWNILIGTSTWTGTNPVFTYGFFLDTNPLTNWGRAYRHSGFGTYAGPIGTPMAILGSGTYTGANQTDYPAMILRTWDDSYWEMIVIRDPNTHTHANQHTNGLPLIETYSY